MTSTGYLHKWPADLPDQELKPYGANLGRDLLRRPSMEVSLFLLGKRRSTLKY